jgi:hypothetical protein
LSYVDGMRRHFGLACRLLLSSASRSASRLCSGVM